MPCTHAPIHVFFSYSVKTMSKIRFSDGVEIDTAGEYRTLKLHDGWYVVGQGTYEACNDRAESIKVRDLLAKEIRDRLAKTPNPKNKEN
jgi:hypothetical protein